MNNDIFLFFYNFSHQTLVLDEIIKFLAVYLPYIVVLLVGVYMVIHHDILDVSNFKLRFNRKWNEVFTALLSAGLGWLVAEIIKNSVQSPRPFEAIDGINSLFPEVGYAFPSQHATFFTALAFAIYLQHKKAGYFFLFLAFAIGLARIAGGVHYPIDILGGIILGILVSYTVHHIRFAKDKDRV